MAISSYKVDEGVLTVGPVGSAQVMTAQITTATVEWSEDVADSVRTLSGEELAGDATYTATLSGTAIQDLSDNGLVEWTWAQKGKVHPFTFTPASATERSITGQLRVGPLDVGGDVGANGPTSDFSWGCIGEPLLGADLT